VLQPPLQRKLPLAIVNPSTVALIFPALIFVIKITPKLPAETFLRIIVLFAPLTDFKVIFLVIFNLVLKI
jgi:hypothetical protein